MLTEKVSVIDMAVSQIKKLISSGKYSVGEKLPGEEYLRDNIGVSRSTVREALRVLQAQGFVEIIRGRGAFVASKEGMTGSTVNWFSAHHLEISDFMEVRIALEPVAAKLAIERASEEEIAALEALFVKFEKKLEKGQCANLAELDERFHTAIFDMTHNKLMIGLNSSISAAFKEYRSRAFDCAERASHALEPHREILNSIKKRDVKTAQKAVLAHLAISLEDIKK